MKQSIISVIFAASLLAGACPVAADAPGSEGDPFITQSYIKETYAPEIVRGFSAKISAAADRLSENKGTASSEVFSLARGAQVFLTQGDSFMLLSGSARITERSGAVVNTTVGYEAGIGNANIYSLYIVCENSSITISIDTSSRAAISSGATVSEYFPFTDVPSDKWYFGDVKNAYENALVDGMSETTFEPYETLTLGQAIKLAACMDELYETGKVTLEGKGVGWYLPYVRYAAEHGIISENYTSLSAAMYDAPISRAAFVDIFYNALPATEYAEINLVPDGAIPDVSMTDDFADKIYAFYRAGILIGYTQTPPYAEGAFGAETTITRAEVAAIMSRMFDADLRQTLDLP